MTKDKKYYQSICVHDFELKNMIGEMTYETCKVCNLNVSRSPKKNLASIAELIVEDIMDAESVVSYAINRKIDDLNSMPDSELNEILAEVRDWLES